jgi:hypothetical protein
MGMYDESWCNGCGTSVPYSDEEQTFCGECAEEYTKSDILSFVKERIALLTEYRENEIAVGENEIHDYTSGAIDAYDIIRLRLEKND